MSFNDDFKHKTLQNSCSPCNEYIDIICIDICRFIFDFWEKVMLHGRYGVTFQRPFGCLLKSISRNPPKLCWSYHLTGDLWMATLRESNGEMVFMSWRRHVLHSLWWRHNDHDSVSNHQPHECLLNRLFRRRSKKTSKLRVPGLCVGNSPGPVNSPHKGPVTRKMFPFDDVIMCNPVL